MSSLVRKTVFGFAQLIRAHNFRMAGLAAPPHAIPPAPVVTAVTYGPTRVVGPVAFLHVDCDVYSSTVDVLRGLAERFQPGTVIVFDEYFNYPGWERHEFKAWQEFISERRVEYAYLGYARQQVALRIVGIGAAE